MDERPADSSLSDPSPSSAQSVDCSAGHKFVVMHHYGEDGKHFCPTGFKYCDECGQIEFEEPPYECNRWGS